MNIEKEFEKLNINFEEEIDNEEDGEMYVLSIDIGVINFGITVSKIDKDFNFIEVIWLDLINMTEFKHRTVSEKECGLYHSRTFSDWLDHVYQDNLKFFEEADFILIEKQPPMGFVAVEQLIFNKYRHKSVLINPRKVHSHFDMVNMDYDSRKVRSQQIALPCIKNKDLLEQLNFYHRLHDICDSLCMLKFWLHKKSLESQYKKRLDRMNKTIIGNGDMNLEEWFEQKRYIS